MDTDSNCTFSTPEVADPACSTDVATYTLQPEQSSFPTIEVLPVTGLGMTSVLMLVGMVGVLLGMFVLALAQLAQDFRRDDEEGR